MEFEAYVDGEPIELLGSVRRLTTFWFFYHYLVCNLLRRFQERLLSIVLAVRTCSF